MARETMPPPPSLAQHIIFKLLISLIAGLVLLTSPFSIETARDMCPRGATNYFCRLDLAARVRVSVFAAVTCFFMPEMFVVVIWTARRVGRVVAAAPGFLKAIPGVLRALGETAVKAYRRRQARRKRRAAAREREREAAEARRRDRAAATAAAAERIKAKSAPRAALRKRPGRGRRVARKSSLPLEPAPEADETASSIKSGATPRSVRTAPPRPARPMAPPPMPPRGASEPLGAAPTEPEAPVLLGGVEFKGDDTSPGFDFGVAETKAPETPTEAKAPETPQTHRSVPPADYPPVSSLRPSPLPFRAYGSLLHAKTEAEAYGLGVEKEASPPASTSPPPSDPPRIVSEASTLPVPTEAEKAFLYSQLDAPRYRVPSAPPPPPLPAEPPRRNRVSALAALGALLVALLAAWPAVEDRAAAASAVRRALDVALVPAASRAVHEVGRERGLLVSQVAAGKGGVELGVQFARTDAALDATLSALLRRADTKKGVYDLSPKRSAVLVERAFEVQMRRELLIEGVPASKGLHTFEEHRCRSRGCRRLKKLLVASREAKKTNASDIFEFYSLLNRNLLVIARDAAVEVLRAPVRGSQLAPSLYASVHLLAYKESCAVERGLVARALAANTNADEVPVATLLRLRDASVRQEAALENFLGFAPSTVRAAFATHAALSCVQDAARVRDELLAPLSHRIDGAKNRGFAWPAKQKEGESLRRRWFETQSCRVDSLQALLDDLDDLVRADAARARRATRGRAGVVAAAALGGLAAYVVLPLAL